MITTVTPNPALDYTFSLPTVSLGESHRVARATLRAGGKGLNVARVLQAQGVDVLAISTAGGHTGREYSADLVGSGIAHRLTQVAADTRRTMTLVETDASHASIFNEFGTNHTRREWSSLASSVASALPEASCLVVSGSLPVGADEDFFARLVTLANERGLPSVIDATGPALLDAATAGATLVKPNRQELQESTGEADPVRAATLLLERGARSVLVSLGAEGMLFLSANDPGAAWYARLPRALRGNATGAGDAAVAAAAAIFSGIFTAAVSNVPTKTPTSEQVDPLTMLTLATSWSAAAVLMPLAGEISNLHTTLATQLIIRRDMP